VIVKKPAGTRISLTSERCLDPTGGIEYTACTDKIHSLKVNRGSSGVELPFGVRDDPTIIGWPPQVRDWTGNLPFCS
jgi:hypothetical protein